MSENNNNNNSSADAEGPWNKQNWHLSKSVNLGHIVSTILLAASIFAWANKMDVRVSLLEQKDQTDQVNVTRIEKKVDALTEKLDKLIYYYQRSTNLNRNSDVGHP